ncbi:MAG: hypothetical protein QM689_01620 [Oscillospiraceae bacterium]
MNNQQQDLAVDRQLYIKASDGKAEIQLINNTSNIAAYLCRASPGDSVRLSTPDNTLILSTFGPFLDQCNDMAYLRNRLQPELERLQTAGKEVPKPQIYQSAVIDRGRGR